MAKNKVIVLIHPEKEAELRVSFERTKKDYDLGSWLIDFLKICIINGRENKEKFIKVGTITKKAFDKEKFITDPKFSIRDTRKVIIGLSGSLFYEGLKNVFRLDNTLNRKEKRSIHPCLEAYVYMLVDNQIKVISDQNYLLNLEQEIEKTKEQMKKDTNLKIKR